MITGLIVDARLTLVSGHAERLAALRSGSIDGSVFNAPFGAIAKKFNFNIVADATALGIPYFNTGMCGSAKVMQKNEGRILNFLRAYVEAIKGADGRTLGEQWRDGGQQAYNAVHGALRCLGERANSLLKTTVKALRRWRGCPWRIGDIVGRKYTFLVTILIMGLSTTLAAICAALMAIFSYSGLITPWLMLASTLSTVTTRGELMAAESGWRLVLAPMAGVTNVAFRTLCRELELARAGTVSRITARLSGPVRMTSPAASVIFRAGGRARSVSSIRR